MTAIAGFIGWDGRDAAPRCAAMLSALAPWGRGAPVSAMLGAAAFGQRVYGLLPEDALERGPLRGAGGTALLTADARIDNREELARDLGISAGDLAQCGNGALILAAWERWGERCWDRLRGSFAVALWDDAARRLLLVRDMAGERPLFWHRAQGFAAFATMPAGLHALDEVPLAPDPTAMADFLGLLPETGGDSFFAGVGRVLPGHWLSIDAEGIRGGRWWHPPEQSLRLRGPADYAEAANEALDRAVRRALRGAEASAGTHLSAGLDSSAVMASAARQLAPGTLHAFTAVPSGPIAQAPPDVIADEGGFAARSAALYPHVIHHRISGAGSTPLDLFDRHFRIYQRPVLNPVNALWHEAINDAARGAGVRVLLTGQMGNMGFSYSGLTALAGLLSDGSWGQAAGLARAMARGGMRWRQIAGLGLTPFLPQALWRRYASWRGGLWDPLAVSAIHPEALARHRLRARHAARNGAKDGRLPRDGRALRLGVLSRVDFGPYCKGTLAGWGLELRDPTMDRDFLELCLAIPDAQYIEGGVPRALARRMIAGRVPPEVAEARRKGLQAADWHSLLAPLRPVLEGELDALRRCAEAEALIDLDRLEGLLSHWPEEAPADAASASLWRDQLMRALSAGHFLRRATGAN